MLALWYLQETPAETTSYMIAGYAIIFIVMGIYIGSLWWRKRNMERDLQLLEEIQSKQTGRGQ